MTDYLSEYIDGLDMEEVRASAEKQQREANEAARQAEAKKNICLLPLSALQEAPAAMQCFHAADEKRLNALRESIHRNGVLSLLIVRPLTNGKYEIIAGRNRCRAARSLGYSELLCIVRDVGDDDEATKLQIADNFLHRDVILPSEKAKAYKFQLDAMKRKAGRPKKDAENLTQVVSNSSEDDNSDQIGQNYHSSSIELLAAESPDSKTQIQRYIRLNWLIPAFLERVDAEKISLQLGAAVSYLSASTQTMLLEYLNAHPDKQLTQIAVEELRKLDAEDSTVIDMEIIAELLSHRTKRVLRVVKLQMKPLRQYFPPDASEEDITKTVQAALEYYFSNRHVGNDTETSKS